MWSKTQGLASEIEFLSTLHTSWDTDSNGFSLGFLTYGTAKGASIRTHLDLECEIPVICSLQAVFGLRYLAIPLAFTISFHQLNPIWDFVQQDTHVFFLCVSRLYLSIRSFNVVQTLVILLYFILHCIARYFHT
jgi:hypothetical protein